MKALIERSGRHCHLTLKDAEALGINDVIAKDRIIRPLSVKGEFATDVVLVDSFGQSYRMLYPFRHTSQVEASLTEFLKIGLKNVPVRHSGDTVGCPVLKLHRDEHDDDFIEVPAIVSAPHLHSSGKYASTVITIGESIIKVSVKHNASLDEDVLHLDNDWYNALVNTQNIKYARLANESHILTLFQ